MQNDVILNALGLGLDAAAYPLGAPQQSGAMTVLPVFGPQAPAGRFAPPLSGLKLGGVTRGYGNVELHHSLPQGASIVPLHMGYIQDGAQNHALCRSALLAPGQRLVFEDACCVQQAQGGFLDSREQWFFVLPLHLREQALALRGQKGFGKLWPAIAALCARFGMAERGHLEQVICRKRATLTQYQSRFEPLPNQTGALLFLRDRLVGVELAPDAEFFRELWMPLACFCYGVAALELEQREAAREPAAPEPLGAASLAELRQRLADSRWERQRRLREPLAKAPPELWQLQEEERLLELRLYTATGQNLAGQVVYDEGRLVYASLAARAGRLQSLN